MSEVYRCVTCDGSGEVHSHNPICWDCRGNGKTDRATAEKAIRSQIVPHVRRLRQFAGHGFDIADEADVVREHLVKV